ncbi:MAG: sensor histidine kinase N-terminal domain-containing protein [Betaproteobacteria bacterium]|nr:sensor histidine kinase N-terminal domain-containing protein [Betaproteobacteria bacterium]
MTGHNKSVLAARRTSTGASEETAARGSLFNEMLDWMLAPLLLLWPLSAALTYIVGISLANDAFDRSLAYKTRALAEQTEWTNEKGEIRLRADLRALLADDESDAYFYRINRKNGEFLLGEPELPTTSTEPFPDRSHVVFRTVDFRETSVRIAALEMVRGPAAESIVVQVAESTEKRNALARDIMKGIVIPQMLVVPLMVLLMWVGLRRGAAPLKRLRDQVMARDVDDVRPLHAPDAPEEIAPLINSFNDLLARIEHEGEAQRRFIANAAHQLRTPLAGIKMQTELALRSVTMDEKLDALKRIAEGTERTAHLINQLLMLARMEGTATDALPLTAVDFRLIAREVVSAAYPHASCKHIDLGFDMPDSPVTVQGSADLLRELVINLVDNAIRYTPASGHITVRVIHGETPQLEVEDDGIGIPPQERELVFERFYRVIRGQEPGSGIGLAIVREIALRHGANVTVVTPHGGVGSLFRVAFPRIVMQAPAKPVLS